MSPIYFDEIKTLYCDLIKLSINGSLKIISNPLICTSKWMIDLHHSFCYLPSILQPKPFPKVSKVWYSKPYIFIIGNHDAWHHEVIHGRGSSTIKLYTTTVLSKNELSVYTTLCNAERSNAKRPLLQ